MKKLLLLPILFFAIISSNAQEDSSFGFTKGDFTISGTMSYSNQDSDSFRTDIDGNTNTFNTKGRNFNVIPEIGYFITSHLMAGLKVGYKNSKSQNNTSDQFSYYSKSRGYSSSVFGRYYFSPQKRISVFIELNAEFSKIKRDSETLNSNIDLITSQNTTKTNSIAATPGINVFINKNLSLTSRIGNLSYDDSKDNFSSSEGDTGVNRRNGINASISLDNFYFGVLYRI